MSFHYDTITHNVLKMKCEHSNLLPYGSRRELKGVKGSKKTLREILGKI